MTGIIILGRKGLSTRFLEECFRLLEGWPIPSILTIGDDMEIDGQPILVCALPGRRGAGSTLQELLIQGALLCIRSATTVEGDFDVSALTAREALDNDWPKRVVQAGEN